MTHGSEHVLDAQIGVDVGGTHTDVEVILGGSVSRGKALTTYDDFSRGALSAIEVAATSFGLSLTELLGRTEVVLNGTTVVTNTITEMRGSQVGVIVTSGFKDTFRISGGPRLTAFDDHLQRNVHDLVSRDAIIEVDGRIDYRGDVRVPLSRDQVRAAGRRLIEDEHVDTIAICFLSSHANPDHELEAEAVLRAVYPDVFISLSHRVHPLPGETRRWTTAVLNSFVNENALTYLRTMDTRLAAAGLKGRAVFFQGLGGAIGRERAERYPLSLLGSGPAAGAIGASGIAKLMGARHVLVGDMGGTSFDTGILPDNQVPISRNVDIGLLRTAVNLVDVKSIGAGGGSIVSVSERGVPQIGPESAGSTPGPACYGLGGTRPTVTDAMVALGVIDPANYLGGRLRLNADLAEEALEPIGRQFDWTAETTAAAVHDLVVTNMANAVHEVSVARGYDPRELGKVPGEFLFLGYGGTLPMFAAQIAIAVGIPEVVIPRNSSVFCARGLLAASFVSRKEAPLSWMLGEDGRLEETNEVIRSLAADAVKEMEGEGLSSQDMTFYRSARLRFMGQVYELDVSLADRDLVANDAYRLAAEFRAQYERVYGQGTAWTGVDTQVTSVSVTAIGPRRQSPMKPLPLDPTPIEQLFLEMRSVYLPSTRSRQQVPVYAGGRFTPGSRVGGPAIIDETDTTIFVPPGVSATRDEFLNFRLSKEQQ